MNTPISQPYFQCERLVVYRIAVKFHRSLVPLRQVRGAADLRDQLLRACESIVLNIAEGAGRYGNDDKHRFLLYSVHLEVSPEQSAALNQPNQELFFDWGPDAARYHAHIKSHSKKDLA